MAHTEEALSSWLNLNLALRTADESSCQRLMNHEKANAYRVRYLLRIHGRLNQLRAERERRDILVGATK